MIPSYSRALKPIIDWILSILILLTLTPVLFLICVALIIETKKIVFSQTRVGQNGKVFRILKFRTMVEDAETQLEWLLLNEPELKNEWDKHHKLHRDPRITFTGRLLRRFKLDEFPQLFNVIRGEMSLVGPRPLVEGEFEKYFSEAAKQKYLSAKPGITGAWTTSGPNASNIDYEERIKLETAYVEDISLSNDLQILLKTAYNAFLGYGI